MQRCASGSAGLRWHSRRCTSGCCCPCCKQGYSARKLPLLTWCHSGALHTIIDQSRDGKKGLRGNAAVIDDSSLIWPAASHHLTAEAMQQDGCPAFVVAIGAKCRRRPVGGR